MTAFKSVILFGLLSTAAFAKPTKRTTCHPGRQTINGQTFTISCNIDRPGGDYDRGQVSWDQCIAGCAANPNCVTAQYHDDIGFCYYKSAFQLPVYAAGEYTVDKGAACRMNNTLTTSNGMQCTLLCGIDRPGGDYASAQSANYLTCAETCAQDPRCVTAQYNEANGGCYFKGSANNMVSKEDTDTIDCRLPPSVTTTTSAAATTTPANSKLPAGASCQSSTVCQSGICLKSGRCGPAPAGSACQYNAWCLSNQCNMPAGSSTGTCS